jgi:hypothetical protein
LLKDTCNAGTTGKDALVGFAPSVKVPLGSRALTFTEVEIKRYVGLRSKPTTEGGRSNPFSLNALLPTFTSTQLFSIWHGLLLLWLDRTKKSLPSGRLSRNQEV